MNQTANQQQVSIPAESQTINAELHSRTESHSGAKLQSNVELQSRDKLQIEENAHFDSEVSTYGRDTETPDKDVHSDIEAEWQSARPRTKPILSKYVRRHHPVDQIIGDKDARPMTRNRLRSATCLLSMKEPKIVKDALEDDN